MIEAEQLSLALNQIHERIKLDQEMPSREDLLTKLAKGERFIVTENIVSYILSQHYLYTLRDDQCPQIWIYQEGIYVPNGRTFIEELTRQMLGEAYTTALSSQVIAKIEADTYIDQEVFFREADPKFIAVRNGILNLETRELQSFTPSMRFFSKQPISYIPNAQCPAVISFFNSLFRDPNEISVVQELFGYVLYKIYFIEKAFMFLGSGRNGKGKTLMLIKRFVGAENCAEIPLEDMEKDQFALSELHKRMANICGDLSTTALKHTGNFKKITGRDMIEAARKFQSRIRFENYAKMIFAANELPTTCDYSEAFFNRWVILDFPYTFLPQEEIDQLPEQSELVKVRDSNIIDKISSDMEMSGLLNWALDGLDRLRDKGTFSHSPSTEQVRQEWLRRSDSCTAFITECVEISDENYILKEQFKKRYAEYCKDHKLSQVSDAAVKHTLQRMLGVTEARRIIDEETKERKLVWQDICFKSCVADAQKSANVRLCSPDSPKNAYSKNAILPISEKGTDSPGRPGTTRQMLPEEELVE